SGMRPPADAGRLRRPLVQSARRGVFASAQWPGLGKAGGGLVLGIARWTARVKAAAPATSLIQTFVLRNSPGSKCATAWFSSVVDESRSVSLVLGVGGAT